MEHDMNVEDLIAAYLRLRDKKEALKKKFKQETAELDEALGQAEAFLSAQMKKMGVDSLTARSAGTVYTSVRRTATLTDRAAFMDFVLGDIEANGAMLDARANAVAVAEHADEFGELPPGVKLTMIETINVRRTT